MTGPSGSPVIDAHCHAWRRWPYDRTVPDPDSRGSIEALLYEMGRHGVDHATVVCARIGGGAGGDGFANPDNNDYVVAAARRHPESITAWVDVDCFWTDSYHRAGAADRLRAETDRTASRGFTHYVAPQNDGWLRSDDGERFFSVAEERGLIASLAVGGAWFDDLAVVARRHPGLPILLHHFGQPRDVDELDRLIALAAVSSIGVKVSGFNYNSAKTFDYPYPDAQQKFRAIRDAFGPARLYWGSDFPASRDMLTYRQSIEVITSHGDLSPDESAAVLGGNLARLLQR